MIAKVVELDGFNFRRVIKCPSPQVQVQESSSCCTGFLPSRQLSFWRLPCGRRFQCQTCFKFNIAHTKTTSCIQHILQFRKHLHQNSRSSRSVFDLWVMSRPCPMLTLVLSFIKCATCPAELLDLAPLGVIFIRMTLMSKSTSYRI